MLLTGKSILKRWEKKYKIPYEYLKFKCTRDFLQGVQCKAYTEKQAESLENAILWDHVKENFNHDRQEYSSIFYGMEAIL